MSKAFCKGSGFSGQYITCEGLSLGENTSIIPFICSSNETCHPLPQLYQPPGKFDSIQA